MNVKQFEKISKALADPSRLMILKEIRKRKDTCLHCHEIFGKTTLTQPSISHHLKQLTDAGLVISEKQGRNVRYTLDSKVLDAYITFLEGFRS
jgi:ArsR family transcriptional regulator